MTTIVKNIKKNKYPIPKDTLALCKKLGVKQLSTVVPSDISFELHDTTTEMANALRRCINSELEVLTMDFDDDSLSTDDSFIILHEIKKRINYIPIRQIMGLEFNLNVYNDTNEIIPVYSSDIVESKKSGNEELFAGTFIVTQLRPGKRLTISNIYITSGVSYKNNASFSFPGKVAYKCLDMPKIVNNKLSKSSMECTPTKYMLTVPRQKYTDPVHIVKMAIATIEKKLDNIYKIIINTNEDSTYSSDMEITYHLNNRCVIKIFNETYTIGNLLSKYGYMVDKTIENIHCIKIHPSFDYIKIEIHHAEPKKIMLSSITLIKKELKRINDAF